MLPKRRGQVSIFVVAGLPVDILILCRFVVQRHFVSLLVYTRDLASFPPPTIAFSLCSACAGNGPRFISCLHLQWQHLWTATCFGVVYAFHYFYSPLRFHLPSCGPSPQSLIWCPIHFNEVAKKALLTSAFGTTSHAQLCQCRDFFAHRHALKLQTLEGIL